MKRIVVGITGASGSIIFKRTVEELLELGHEVYVCASEYAEQVFEYELDLNFRKFCFNLNSAKLHVSEINDMFSKIASGSFKTDGMIIAPCSMGTVGKIANGTSDNLLIRAADVHIKEHRKTLIIPREAPFSTIHLQNLLTLSQSGVYILPPVPAFYMKPKTVEDIVDQIVGRALDYFDIENSLKRSWEGI
ncbi:MAG: UbiX family flavin prenyltransferase [Haloplasmataceae bacterium]|jgi:4-hydroxy-3-polyprenylbenzoate decarboxylase|nr:UbiX family flavin prenyltransferase [Haloplasmataceae bacterium]